jgi:hypothetical protein
MTVSKILIAGFLTLAAILLPGQSVLAASAALANGTRNCAHVTFYGTNIIGTYEIVRVLALPPGAKNDGGCSDCKRIKVRAEVYPGAACGGSKIGDVSYITNRSHDPLSLIKNSSGRYQILRR